MNFLDFLRRLIRKPESPSGNGKIPPEMIGKMMDQIAHTQEVEYTCDEVLELLDQFAEASLRDENVAELMPLVQHHLEMCGDCREEFEALLRILRASPTL